MRNSIQKAALPVLCFAVLLLFALQADAVRSAVTGGLKTCAGVLIPALFPYFVLTNLLVRSGGAGAIGEKFGRWMRPVFRVSDAAVLPLILGFFGGYPLGAKTIGELCKSGAMSKDDAQKALLFCNNAGPALFIGVIGGSLLNSAETGALLFLIHILSALLTGFLLRGRKAQAGIFAPAETKAIPFSSALVSSVSEAAKTMVTVCAFVVTFSVICELVTLWFSGEPILSALLRATLELTGGCIALSAAPIAWAIKLPLLSAASAWGGLSVHLQSMATLQESGLTFHRYVIAKFLQSALSGILTVPFALLLQPSFAVAVQPQRLAPFSPFPWLAVSFGLFFLIFLQIPTGNSEQSRL